MLLSRIATVVMSLLLGVGTLAGQAAPAVAPMPAPTPVVDSAEIKEVVEREFGQGFTIDTSSAVIYGDFDGDGVPDLALVAEGKNPLTSAVEFDFKVIDPYNAFYGYGDPKVTMTFGTDIGKPHYVLVLHSWQETTAKPKFVVVNLPFEHIEITHTYVKIKKLRVKIAAISAQEAGGITSMIYWDGKKYKWQVTGSVN